MPLIRVTGFNKSVPRKDPELLDKTEAYTAENCVLDDGKISSLKDLLYSETVNGLRVYQNPTATYAAGTQYYIDDFVYYATDGISYRCIANSIGNAPGNLTYWVEDYIYVMSGSTQEISSVDTVADVANSLDGKYFLISTRNTDFHVWFNTSGGAATDPSPGSSYPIEVAITTDDSANTVATKIKTELDKRQCFTTARTNNQLTITHTHSFNAADVTTVAAGDSGFTCAVDTPGVLGDYVVTGYINSIWLLNDKWLNWGGNVDVVKSFYENNDNLIYFTGDGIPQMTNYTAAISGETYEYPKTTYPLGIPAPATALTAALDVGAGSIDTALTATWVYTYVVTIGTFKLEGPPSPASNSLDVAINDRVELTGVTAAPTWAPALNVTHVRFYRLKTGSSLEKHQQLPVLEIGASSYDLEIAIGTAVGATILDDNNDSALLGVIKTTGFDAPDDNMIGIIQCGNSDYAGFYLNEVFGSEPLYPYAWPYSWKFPDNVVGLAYTQDTKIVWTEGQPGIISGNDPNSAQQKILPYQRKCRAKKGIVATEAGSIAPVDDGLFMISGVGGDLITKNIWTKDQWQEFDLANIFAVYYEGKYIAFFKNSGDGFIFNLAEPDGVITFNVSTLKFLDARVVGSDLFVLAEDASDNSFDVYKWNAGTTYLTALWESKDFVMTGKCNMSVARVKASGSVTFRLYADGVLKHTETVTTDDIFTLPGGYEEEIYKFAVESSGVKIKEVEIATSPEEMEQ